LRVSPPKRGKSPPPTMPPSRFEPPPTHWLFPIFSATSPLFFEFLSPCVTLAFSFTREITQRPLYKIALFFFALPSPLLLMVYVRFEFLPKSLLQRGPVGLPSAFFPLSFYFFLPFVLFFLRGRALDIPRFPFCSRIMSYFSPSPECRCISPLAFLFLVFPSLLLPHLHGLPHTLTPPGDSLAAESHYLTLCGKDPFGTTQIVPCFSFLPYYGASA